MGGRKMWKHLSDMLADSPQYPQAASVHISRRRQKIKRLSADSRCQLSTKRLSAIAASLGNKYVSGSGAVATLVRDRDGEIAEIIIDILCPCVVAI
jgi:hypothetical protein